jgi:hypothetical protein
MTIAQVVQNLRAAGNTADADEVEQLQRQVNIAHQSIVQLADDLRQAAVERVEAQAERARAMAEVNAVQARNAVARQANVAAARKDLIRRLIAVAISVGFASQVVAMKVVDWWSGVQNIADPSETLARLFTALLVILLSWDWYDRDVDDKPLTRILRFILDAFIVIADLALLLSSGHAHLWWSLLAIIFASYIVWDILSIIDHPAAFGFPAPRQSRWRALKDMGQTYWDGLWGAQRRRGPAINLEWFAYFLAVLLLAPSFLPFPGKFGSFVACLMVAVGAWVLWCEGVRRDNGGLYIAWWGRLLAMAVLIGGYAVCRHILP